MPPQFNMFTGTMGQPGFQPFMPRPLPPVGPTFQGTDPYGANYLTPMPSPPMPPQMGLPTMGPSTTDINPLTGRPTQGGFGMPDDFYLKSALGSQNFRGNQTQGGLVQNIPGNQAQRSFIDQLNALQSQLAQGRTQYAIGSPERQQYRELMQNMAPMFKTARENFEKTGIAQFPSIPRPLPPAGTVSQGTDPNAPNYLTPMRSPPMMPMGMGLLG